MAGGLTGAPGAARLDAVRRWSRTVRPTPSIGRRLDLLYTIAISTFLVGALTYGTASSALAQVLDPRSLGRWGPALAVVALLGIARWGAVQGPVVFSIGDAALLLGAPLPRRGLVARRLLRAYALAACGGALTGGVLVIGLTGDRRAIAVTAACGVVAGCALAAVLAVAAAWVVQSTGRRERLLRAITPPALLVAAGLALAAGAGRGGRSAVLWSGPWGWALQPGAGVATARWAAALAVLAAVCAVAVTLTLRGCGAGTTERHLRRAEGRLAFVASLVMFDARSARQTLGGVAARRSRGAAGDLRRVRVALARLAADGRGAAYAGEAAVVWRGAVAARRTPRLVAQAALLCAGGTALSLLRADHRGAPVLGALLVYLAATRLLEPLRAELDLASRPRAFLGLRVGRALLAHVAVPSLVLAGAAALTAAAIAVAGALPANGAAAALATVVAAPAIACCAGLSGRRGGRLSQETLFMAIGSDPSGGAIILLAWLVAWPAAAVVAGALPLLLAVHAHDGAAWLALPVAAGAAVALARLLRR